MRRIGAPEVRGHLPRQLDRVASGERPPTAHRGKPVARTVPVTHDSTRAHVAAARIIERRRHIECAPLADLLATIREGHRH